MSTRPHGRADEINFGGGVSTTDVYEEATPPIFFFQKFQDFEQKLIILLMFSPFLPALPVTTLAN